MTKSEADKIAKEIAEHSGIAYESVRNLVKDKISAALVDASKVTECAEFEEAWNKSSDAKNENSMLKRFANHWFSIGQKSKALKLPSEEEQRKFVDLHFCYSGLEYNSVGHIAKDAIELLKKFCDAVKSLNEGK